MHWQGLPHVTSICTGTGASLPVCSINLLSPGDLEQSNES
jgi:hypothetical protein